MSVGRSLAETPTWTVATVITTLVAVGFLIQRSINSCGKVEIYSFCFYFFFFGYLCMCYCFLYAPCFFSGWLRLRGKLLLLLFRRSKKVSFLVSREGFYFYFFCSFWLRSKRRVKKVSVLLFSIQKIGISKRGKKKGKKIISHPVPIIQ